MLCWNLPEFRWNKNKEKTVKWKLWRRLMIIPFQIEYYMKIRRLYHIAYMIKGYKLYASWGSIARKLQHTNLIYYYKYHPDSINQRLRLWIHFIFQEKILKCRSFFKFVPSGRYRVSEQVDLPSEMGKLFHTNPALYLWYHIESWSIWKFNFIWFIEQIILLITKFEIFILMIL